MQARWHGDGDEGISKEGCSNAKAAGERLRAFVDDHVGLVVSSHLRRAVETAHILAVAVNVQEVTRDDQLAERKMGEWSGRSPAEVDALWPGVLESWTLGKIDGPPGGEKDSAVARRAREALKQYANGNCRFVLVVTHGGVIRALRHEAGLENEPIPYLGGNVAWMDPRTYHLAFGPEIILGDRVLRPLT